MQLTGTRIHYVEFIKRTTGELRKMWFIPHIKKSLLKGGELKFSPRERNLIVVRDIKLPDNDCIRMIPIDAIKKLSYDGKRMFEVSDEKMDRP